MAGKKRQNIQLKDGQQVQYDTIKVRLYPTEAQQELFQKTFGCCRYIWNRMLSDQQRFYAETDVHFIPTPAKYKKEAPFLGEVDNQALIQEHNRLAQAFRVFFKDPEHFHRPCFKKKKDDRDSFTACNCFSSSGSTLYLTKNGIRMTKAGIVRAKLHRRPQSGWELKRITVERTRGGHYFGCLLYSHVVSVPSPVVPSEKRTLGLKNSMQHFYTTDHGEKADPPKWMKQSQDKLAAIQRKLSRMSPGSKNYQEQVRKYHLLHEHIANQRRDYLHKESTRIANAWDAVCLRSDSMEALARIMTLAHIQEQGFGMFREMLRYKLERRGKPLILVERYTPTTRVCSACGCVLGEAVSWKRHTWVCPDCGAVLNREVNAAQNIKADGLAQYFQSQSA